MKKLQNNFTTPEQSKRLLELGVPEWTADCVLRHYNWAEGNLNENNWEFPCVVWTATELDRFIDDEYDKVLPCWSVGRLIEIYDICRCYDGDWDEVYGKETYIETYISAIEDALSDEMLDFSKLEE